MEKKKGCFGSGVRHGKYNSVKHEYDGLVFDSKKEMKRYIQLVRMQSDGIISDLQRQVTYELIPVQKEMVPVQLKTKTKMVERVVERPCTYTADFVYLKDGRLVVEDSKGMRTDKYMIKKKLMLYIYGIKILET